MRSVEAMGRVESSSSMVGRRGNTGLQGVKSTDRPRDYSWLRPGRARSWRLPTVLGASSTVDWVLVRSVQGVNLYCVYHIFIHVLEFKRGWGSVVCIECKTEWNHRLVFPGGV